MSAYPMRLECTRRRDRMLLCAALALASLTARAQDLATGLAACAELPESRRAQCEQVMNETAACWTLAGDERQRCQQAVAASDAPRDPCARAADRAQCEEARAARAARDACRDEPGPSRTACQEARRAPRAADCSHKRAEERFPCEIHTRVLESCRAGTIAEVRACLEQNYRKPLQQVLDGFNPLDCREPQAAFATACALRGELLARCRELGAEGDRCMKRYTEFSLQECSGLAESVRGQCAARNAGFEFCQGRQGRDLRTCLAPHNGLGHESTDCSRGERSPPYCADRDRAFGICAARRTPPAEFRDCVDSELSLSYKFQHWLYDRAWVPH